MNTAELNGTTITYLDEGKGQPIVLVHGFASSAKANWIGPGWVNTLNDAGYRVIALDNRGHGGSTKYYSEDDYTLADMASDVSSLIDNLNLEMPHVMGYSMGARITTTLAHLRGAELGKIIIAGNGYNMIEGGFDTNIVRDALLAESEQDVEPGLGLNFRLFAEKTGNDLKALAACIKGRNIERSVFESLQNETLVIIGDEDDIAVRGDELAALMPNGRFESVPKRNHMNVVGDKVYKAKVLEFLGG